MAVVKYDFESANWSGSELPTGCIDVYAGGVVWLLENDSAQKHPGFVLVRTQQESATGLVPEECIVSTADGGDGSWGGSTKAVDLPEAGLKNSQSTGPPSPEQLPEVVELEQHPAPVGM